MGQIYASITLANPVKPDLDPVTTTALVDTGALFLCIPEHIAIQLQLTEYEKREVTATDGRRQLVPYVGPIKINFEKRVCLTGALVLGEMILLRAIPIEDMDLVIHPAQLKLVANPQNPNIPGALVV